MFIDEKVYIDIHNFNDEEVKRRIKKWWTIQLSSETFFAVINTSSSP